MLLRLFVLFTLIPIAELAVLIQIGRWAGTVWAIALVLATGAFGALLAKSQGTAVLLRIRDSLEQGVLPGSYQLPHSIMSWAWHLSARARISSKRQ